MEYTIDKSVVLSENAGYTRLTIAPGAEVSAPEGKIASLVVNGVQQDFAPGVYEGDIKVYVTEGQQTPISGKESGRHDLVGAVVLAGGNVCRDDSVLSAYTGGVIQPGRLSGGVIESRGNFFNGMIIKDGRYEIDGLAIRGTGHGDDDFAGHGVGMIIGGDAEVTLNHVTIRNQGIQRNAIVVGGRAKVTVKNSDILSMGGTPEQIQEMTPILGRKAQQALICGGWGTTRCVNLINNATVTFEDCKIQSENWGVLATDDTASPEVFGEYTTNLTARRCDVRICGDHGYGTYAIGACNTVFEDCTIYSPDMGMKVANEYARVTLKNSKLEAGRFAALFRGNQTGGLYCYNSELSSGRTMLAVPACFPEIYMENCKLFAGNRTILQVFDPDDPGMNADKGKEVDTEVPVKDPEHDPTKESHHDIKLFGFDVPDACTDCRATFKDMDIFGNFYNSITNAQKPMTMMPPAGRTCPGGKAWSLSARGRRITPGTTMTATGCTGCLRNAAWRLITIV